MCYKAFTFICRLTLFENSRNKVLWYTRDFQFGLQELRVKVYSASTTICSVIFNNKLYYIGFSKFSILIGSQAVRKTHIWTIHEMHTTSASGPMSWQEMFIDVYLAGNFALQKEVEAQSNIPSRFLYGQTYLLKCSLYSIQDCSINSMILKCNFINNYAAMHQN
jgi:hypothetical protein